MSYFSDNSIEESSRRNDAFQILCALREAVTIAKRTQQAIPYKKKLFIWLRISHPPCIMIFVIYLLKQMKVK